MSSKRHYACMVSYGQNLKREREKLGLNRGQFAKIINVTPGKLQSIEAGTSLIPASSVILASSYLHIRPSDIFGEYSCDNCKTIPDGCFNREKRESVQNPDETKVSVEFDLEIPVVNSNQDSQDDMNDVNKTEPSNQPEPVIPNKDENPNTVCGTDNVDHGSGVVTEESIVPCTPTIPDCQSEQTIQSIVIMERKSGSDQSNRISASIHVGGVTMDIYESATPELVTAIFAAINYAE